VRQSIDCERGSPMICTVAWENPPNTYERTEING